MNNELSVFNPEQLARQSSDVAGLCREMALKCALSIQGRKYLPVEVWQSIATAHGCVSSARNVERIEGGFRAIGELRRISDGSIICEAEGFVGEDEPTWFGGQTADKHGNIKILPKRADYAIRAMAQTRAISRVCRSAFAHVVVLMDAGLSTTPAEEVPSGGFDSHHETRQESRSETPRQEHRTEDKKVKENITASNFGDYVVKMGKPGGPIFGKKVSELNSSQLNWFKEKVIPKWDEARDKMRADDIDLEKALNFRLNPEAEIKEIKPSENWHKVLLSQCEFNETTPEEVLAVGIEAGLVPEGVTVLKLSAQQVQLLCEKFEHLIDEINRKKEG